MDHMVAGVLAGALSTTLLHPIDLIKVRFQVHGGKFSRSAKYRSAWQSAKAILNMEHARGFYKGLVPAVMGSGSSWGLYFFFYESSKRALMRDQESQQLSTSQHMLAAWQAGTATVFLTNPIWLLKTRLQLQDGSHQSGHRPYTGVLDGVRSIVREEGYRGFYRGIVPALLLTSHGVIQFAVYEEVKQYNPDIDTVHGSAANLISGGFSKLIATSATYPSQVLKARLQQRSYKYKGFWDCLIRSVREEGFLTLYSGFGPNLVRVVPSSAITLLSYEHIKRILQSLH